MSYTDVVPEDLDSALTSRVRKILDTAEANGWQPSYHSFAVRFSKPDDPLARPWFARWDLHKSPDGKRSWRFAGARASNGQALGYSDVLVYIQDSSVIYPEPPGSGTGEE